MSRAGRLIADAVAATIAAAITAEIPTALADDADRTARRALTELAKDGWHITATALPTPATENTHR